MRIRDEARARGLSVSRYLAEIIQREVTIGWPDGFFEKVVGAWKAEPLERAPQGEFEVRDEL
ncbi:hypothetical protein MYX78_07955 [Acidobacteria bacterium AH-259-G07]|nr:hypothetical protein [Acidobacteria bacterium AH-259-G07]